MDRLVDSFPHSFSNGKEFEEVSFEIFNLEHRLGALTLEDTEQESAGIVIASNRGFDLGEYSLPLRSSALPADQPG